MNIRHLVTKSFDDGNKIRDSLIVEGVPFNFNITSIDEISEFNATDEKSYEVDVNFSEKEVATNSGKMIAYYNQCVDKNLIA